LDRITRERLLFDRTLHMNLKCPKCNSEKVIPIVYGLPTDDAFKAADEGKVVLGGCIVHDDRPFWHCSNCEYDWT
jgi:hypothetical protein